MDTSMVTCKEKQHTYVGLTGQDYPKYGNVLYTHLLRGCIQHHRAVGVVADDRELLS